MASASRRRRWTQLNATQAGQGLVEYALILVLIALVAIASLAFFGSSVSGYLSMIGKSV